MEKAARKIFQPNVITSLLIEGACDKGGENITEFTNRAIENYYTPINPTLRKETEFIFQRIADREEISDLELKATLARCVEILKNYPISNVEPLEQIFIHFTNKSGRKLRYDYIQIVDSQQDNILHRLNEILKTVDSDFTLGMREFGERSRYVFDHWDKLQCYSEIYIALSTIIECESIYYPLSIYRTVALIKWLDSAVTDSTLEPIKTPYPTDISVTDRYYGISYEIDVYTADNGYAALSGDNSFDHMPDTIREYYQKLYHKGYIHGEPTEEDLQKISAIEQEGRMLFRRLGNNQSK